MSFEDFFISSHLRPTADLLADINQYLIKINDDREKVGGKLISKLAMPIGIAVDAVEVVDIDYLPIFCLNIELEPWQVINNIFPLTWSP